MEETLSAVADSAMTLVGGEGAVKRKGSTK